MSDGNEIVIKLTEAEFDRLRQLLNDAWYAARGKRGHDRIREILHLVCHNANDLTLNWIDRELEDWA